MKTVKLIVDGKKVEALIDEKDLEELINKKINGYERVNGGYYYYDNGYTVDTILDTGNPTSVDLYDAANYYSNINIANNNARADKLMRQLRRFAVEHREKDIDWTDENQNKYYIYYNYKDRFLIDYANHYRDFGQIYFDTEETAKLAVKTFKDELLWYFTEYYDSL